MSRRYRNPPIIEALCEIHFDASAWDLTTPGLFYSRVQAEFPDKSDLQSFEVEVELDPAGTRTQTRAHGERMVLRSADKSRVLQIQRDLLVFNRLQPYSGFDEWLPTVLELARVYSELAAPTSISRITLRYINRVELPQVEGALSRYFKVFPSWPREVATTHGDFLLRLQVPSRNPGHELVVTFGSAAPIQPKTTCFLLDIVDSVAMGAPPSLVQLQQLMIAAHENVEHIFEGMITQDLRTLFDTAPGHVLHPF